MFSLQWLWAQLGCSFLSNGNTTLFHFSLAFMAIYKIPLFVQVMSFTRNSAAM